jgi:hypothetical protein
MRGPATALLCALLPTLVIAVDIPLSFTLPSNCQMQTLPPKATATEDEERGCFNDYASDASGQAQRLLLHGIPGCGGDGPVKGLAAAPACDPDKLTPDMCGAMCFSMGLVVNKGVPYRLAGVEDGRQCFCDSVRNPKYPLGNKREKLSDCSTPCPGDPTLKCGASFRIEIAVLSCTTLWGWPVTLALFIGSILYAGGGIIYNVKMKGLPPGPKSLPNTGQSQTSRPPQAWVVYSP